MHKDSSTHEIRRRCERHQERQHRCIRLVPGAALAPVAPVDAAIFECTVARMSSPRQMHESFWQLCRGLR